MSISERLFELHLFLAVHKLLGTGAAIEYRSVDFAGRRGLVQLLCRGAVHLRLAQVGSWNGTVKDLLITALYERRYKLLRCAILSGSSDLQSVAVNSDSCSRFSHLRKSCVNVRICGQLFNKFEHCLYFRLFIVCDTCHHPDPAMKGNKGPLGSKMVSNSGSTGDGTQAKDFGFLSRARTSLSSGARWSPLVSCEDSVSVDWWFTAAQWMISNLNSDS